MLFRPFVVPKRLVPVPHTLSLFRHVVIIIVYYFSLNIFNGGLIIVPKSWYTSCY